MTTKDYRVPLHATHERLDATTIALEASGIPADLITAKALLTAACALFHAHGFTKPMVERVLRGTADNIANSMRPGPQS